MDTLVVILLTLSALQVKENRFDSLAKAATKKFDKEIFIPMLNERHCSDCVHYEPCSDFRMYCKELEKRITARKKPCRYYKAYFESETKDE